jgi:putative DNA primase/helicase
MADVEPMPIKWLWPGRIALGKPSCLSGDPGDGKSVLSCDLAARVSTGARWPDGSGHAPLGSVVMMNAEDDVADTIRPRLDAAGADVSKIHVLQGTEYTNNDGEKREKSITLQDIELITDAITGIPDCRLITLDPVGCYVGDSNSHKDAEVRAALVPLVKLAGDRSIAIVYVAHLNKGNGAAKYRVMGSLAFVAAARTAFLLTRDKNDSEGRRRLFLPVKNNIGDDRTGLAYILQPAGQTVCVSWEVDAVHISADEALSSNAVEASTPKDRRRTRTEKAWCDEFLRTYDSLVVGRADGLVGYSEIKDASGLNSKAMNRAVFLLSDQAIIAVESIPMELPKGGKKSRKAIRRLRGGQYSPGNLEGVF